MLTCGTDCQLDESGCEDGGGGGGGGGDPCPPGDEGCIDGPCAFPQGPGAVVTPADLDMRPGMAAYADLGLCFDSQAVCRKGADEVYRCFDCTAPGDSGWGCPCIEGLDVCANFGGGMQCAGLGPVGAQYPQGADEGRCFPGGQTPAGYCEENCLAQGRVCGSVLPAVGLDVCITPECAPGPGQEPCEQQGLTCDRDAGSCVAPCLVDAECGGNLCTTWGECWGGP